MLACVMVGAAKSAELPYNEDKGQDYISGIAQLIAKQVTRNQIECLEQIAIQTRMAFQESEHGK